MIPSLFSGLDPVEPPAPLPETPLDETVVQDYDALGFSLNAHPMELVRAELDALGSGPAGPGAPGLRVQGSERGIRDQGSEIGERRPPAQQSKIQSRRAGTKSKMPQVIRNADLKQSRPGQRLAVSGLVTVRQRPGTAKGITFMTLEDETGMANLIIRPTIWDRDREIARGHVALIAEGVVERQGDVIHVMVRQFFDLAATLRAARAEPHNPLADLNHLRHPSRDFH